MKKLLFNLSLYAFFAAMGNVAAIENSIIPEIDNALQADRHPIQKYSYGQYEEIKSALQYKGEKIRIVSFNMLANDKDPIREKFNRWPQRLPRIVELLQEMSPDLIDSQELYQDQLDELIPYLEEDYAFYGHPRSDGELNGIFYRKSRFKILKSEVVAIPQSGGIANNFTMVQFKDLITESIFAVFNTHLAFGANDREHEVRFILDNVKPVADQMPVVFTGDLNTFPNRLDLRRLPYYDGDYIHRLLTAEIFYDSIQRSLLGHLGPISTFTNAPENGVPFQGTGTPGVMLDHIYVTRGITVLIHAVQPATFKGHFPSDHMPILVDFIFDKR